MNERRRDFYSVLSLLSLLLVVFVFLFIIALHNSQSRQDAHNDAVARSDYV